MAITSEDIQNQSFSIDRKGYDVDEVDVFLEHVADEIDFLNDTIANLQSQLAEASAMKADQTVVMEAVEEETDITETDLPDDIEAVLAEKDAIIADLENQLVEKQANDSAISQALIIAQRSADEIIVKANAQASETMQDAREEADRIISRANMDKQEVVDAIRKLEDEREDTRTGYADLLRDFIDDATTKLNELGYDDDIDAIPDAGDIGIVYEEDVVEYEGEAEPAAPIVATAEPVASVHEKDLSGFGDVEDDFEDID